MQYKKKFISDNIIKAGKDEFLEKGYRGGNIANIAVRANVPVGNLYRYFDGKAGLLDAIVKPVYTTVPAIAASFAQMGADKNISVEELMRLLAVRLLETFDKYGEELLILADKCITTRYEDFTDIVVDKVLELILVRIYTDPTETDKLMSRLIAKSFVSSLFDILRCKLSREKTEEMLNRMLTYHFLNIEARH